MLRPHAISNLQDIQADSLVLDLPDQILTEGRGFGHTFSASRHDSSVAVTFEDCTTAKQDCMLTCLGPDVNCIAGDTLTARWVSEPDSSGTPRNRIQRIIARGAARAVTHLTGRPDSTDTGPALNYSRGKVIDIALKQSRIDRVQVSGQADGVHLEPRPPAPPDTTAQKDST